MMAVGNQTGDSTLWECMSDNEKRVNKKVAVHKPNSICSECCRDAGRRELKLISFFITTVFPEATLLRPC